MRLAPIEKPPTLFARIAYWVTRRRFGKVITPLKVVYVRVPRLLRLGHVMAGVMEKGLVLDPETQYLITTYVARLNGCDFCVDIGSAFARYRGVALRSDADVANFRKNPSISERQRAALAYVDEASRNKVVSDETFETLRRHFNDREIVEITWLNAVENYYNLINIPLEIESDGLCAVPLSKPATQKTAATQS